MGKATGPVFDFRTDPPMKHFEFMVDRFTHDVDDMSDLFIVIGERFKRQMVEQFASEGSMGSGRWTPLTDAYRAWKEAHFPGQKIGHLTGALRSSMIGGDGYEQKISKRSATYGMSASSKAAPYGRYFAQRRPVIDATAARGLEFQKDAHEWLVDRAHHAGLTGAMSSVANKPLPSTDFSAALPST